MIGIDSNVLLRFLVEDDLEQLGRTARFLNDEVSESIPGFVNRVVLAEIVWVLRTAYGFDRHAIADAVRRLVALPILVVEDADLAVESARKLESEAFDFSDVLIALSNRRGGCSDTVTFDRSASRIPGMRLL
jgi:predicted nucleic-acid-binding protein